MSIFKITGTAGTDVTVFCDYADAYGASTTLSGLTYEEDWSADIVTMRTFNMTYAQAGYFNVTCWASNNGSFVATSAVACVGIIFEGTLTGTETDINVSTITTLNMNFIAGTFLTMNINFGDGVEFQTEFDNYTTAPTNLGYGYHTLGRYNINGSMCNCLSCEVFTFPINVGIPISHSTYTTTSPTALGTNTSLSLRLSNSSQTRCVMTFDTGHYTTFYALFTEIPMIATYLFNETGVFNTNVFCENLFGNVSLPEPVYVDEMIGTLTLNATYEFIKSGESVAILAEVDSGTNVAFDAECDSIMCGSVSPNTPLSVVLVVSGSELPPFGNVNLTIQARNSLGGEVDEIVVSIDQMITDAAFQTNPMYVRTHEEYTVFTSCATGSRINFQFNPGDGSTTLGLSFSNDELSSTFVHSWAAANYYVANFTAINNISSDSTIAMIVVENPVPPINYIVINTPDVTDVSEAVILHWSYASAGDNPSSVELELNFGDGSDAVTILAPLTVADDGIGVAATHTYSRFGDYLVSGMFRNNVSNASFSDHPVRVGVPISGQLLTASPMVAAVGDTITFTLHVDAGSNVSHTLNFGNTETITTVRVTSTWTTQDNKIWTYQYSAPNAAYSPNITSGNVFGTVGPTQLANGGTILIQSVVPDLVLITAHYHNTDIANASYMLTKLNPDDTEPSVPISCSWSYDAIVIDPDVTTNELAMNVTYMYSYGASLVGNHTMSVNCSNEVSWRVATAEHIVQDSISGAAVTPVKPVVAVGEVAIFDLSVTAGSHIIHTFNLSDNSPLISTTHPNMIDSTSVLQVSHTYQSSANLTVTLFSRNNVSKETATAYIIVQRSIPDGILLANDPYAMPNISTIGFTISPPPGITLDDVYFELDPGDGGESIHLFGGDLEAPSSISTQYIFRENNAPPDSTPITLNASNLVSFSVIEGTIKLENPLVGYTFALIFAGVTCLAVKPNDVITLHFGTTGGTDLTFAGVYDDATVNDTFTTNIEPAIHTSFTHAFVEPGMHTILGHCFNNVSSDIITQSCKVETPVVAELLTITVADSAAGVINKTVVRDGVGGTINITFDIVAGAPRPTDVSVNITFWSGAVSVTYDITSFPKMITSPRYKTTGESVITTVTYNLVSSVTNTHPIEVQEMLHRPIITVPDIPVIFTFPLQQFEVDVEKGTHFNIVAYFRDGHAVKGSVANVPGPHSFNYSGYTYSLPGPYELLVRVWNDFENLTETANVLILADLPNMTLITNSVLEVSHDSTTERPVATFMLIIEEEDRFPVDCKVSFDPGDKKAVKILDRSIINDIAITNTYDTHGFYFATINVTTLFDYKFYETIMSVQERVSEVTLVISEAVSAKQNETYYVGSNLRFDFIHAHGTGANYTIVITNVATSAVYHSEVTNNAHILWTMASPGEYRAVVTVNNGIGNDDADGKHPRIASSNVSIIPNGIIVLFDYLAAVGSDEPADFTLQLSNGVSLIDICVKIRLGNEFIWYANAEHYCTDLNDHDYINVDHSVEIHDGSNTIILKGHTFNKAGQTAVYINVTYAAATQYNMVTTIVNVTVYCHPPKITIKPKSKLLHAFRTNRILISFENFVIDILCTAVSQIHVSFELVKYANYTARELGNDITSDIKAVIKADGLHIEPLELEIDYYYIRFTVGMGPAGGPFASLKHNTTLDLNVLPTNISVAFTVGIYELLGNTMEVQFNASVTNPDDPSITSGYDYKWFCYEYGVDDSWAQTNIMSVTNASIIDIPTNGLVTDNGRGGCFGMGPGILRVMDNINPILTLNTGYMPINKSYVIAVLVSKNGNTAMARTRLRVESGGHHKLTVRCTGSNCLAKINHEQDTYFIGECATCPRHTPNKYVWKITALNGLKQTLSFGENLDLFQTHNSEVVLKIPAGTLDEGLHYEVELLVESPDGTKGKMISEFYVNFRPRYGTCSSDPDEGNTTTLFTFMCENWQDDGHVTSDIFTPSNDTLISYEYFYFDHIGVERYIAGDTTKLPSGDPKKDHMITIKSYVIDPFHMTVTNQFQVQVKPINDSFMIREAMKKLTNTDLSRILLQLNSNLAEIALISNLAAAFLDAMAVDGTHVTPPNSDAAYEPAGSRQYEMALQAQEERLQIIDDAMGLFVNMLKSGSSVSGDARDAEGLQLSIHQVINVAKTINSIPLPTDTFPSTMKRLFDVIASLETFVNGLDVDLTDTELVAQAMELVNVATILTSKALEASQDILLHETQTDESFNDAIMDAAMTEDEEARQRELHAKNEDGMSAVKATAMNAVLSIVDSVTNTLMLMTVDTRTIQTPMISMAVAAINPENPIDEQPIVLTWASGNASRIIFTGFSGAGPGDKLLAKVVAIDKSLFKSQKGGDINRPVLTITLNAASKDGTINDLSDTTFDIEQPQQEVEDIPQNCSDTGIWDETTGMMYTYANLTDNSAYHLLLEPLNKEGITLTVYLMTNCPDVLECRPNKTYFADKRELPQSNLPNPWQATFTNVSGLIYIGVDILDATTGPEAPKPKFCTKSGASRCMVYDSRTSIWSVEGDCTVSENSTIGTPICDCTAPDDTNRRRRAVSEDPQAVSYASGFTAPQVNPIDFKNIFDNFSDLLGDNSAVFATVFVMLGLYIVLSVWARWSDRKDIEKNKNFYKVSVFTGMRKGAGTKSNICFILTGDSGDTGPMELKDARNRTFSPSSIRQFVLGSEQDLGQLTFMRIWHDNTGKGDAASWYLEKIIVEDLQTKNRYFFLCGRWLAVDKDDGLLERILPTAGRQEILAFNHLFFDKVRRKLFDDHLWISLVGRPSRSNFSRLQRLTCILCLLFTTMLANAMWYGAAQVENDNVLKIGPITLSGATILVSIYGGLTVVPINTIVMMLFRKHRPKEWPSDNEVLSVDGTKIKVQTAADVKTNKKWWKGKYPLPYWCSYIAWALAIGCSLVSMLVVIFYSLQWGKEKAEEWLSSLLLSTAQSVILIQPVKVLILAGFLSLLFKSLDDDDDDVGERHNNGNIKTDEEFTDENLTKLNELVKIQPPEPLSQKKLARARAKRLYDSQMATILREAGFYLAFLLLIVFIVWGSKNPLLYYTNNMLLSEMAGGSVEQFKTNVDDWEAFWKWSQESLVPRLFYMYHYNGNPGTPRDRQYLSDGSNVRVSPLVMRQVRVKPDSCNTVIRLKQHIPQCNDVYSMFGEENRNFSLKWHLDPRIYGADELTTAEQAYKYRHFTDLKSIPYMGLKATYGGGGYVANLGITKSQALAVLKDLLRHEWIDHYTRAVFVEFTIYNPNINMFAYVNYLLESPATGAVLPNPKIMAFQVYARPSGMALVVLACEILYMFLIVYFMIREGVAFSKLRREYWRNPWNYVELIIILMSWTALGLYMLREVVGRLVLDSLAEQKEKFTNFSLFAYYDEVYWYLIGVIVFLCNIKFLRLLRFNTNISQFTATLKLARKDLLYFTVTFLILFVAFALSGFILFGSSTLEFSSFITSTESLFSMLVGRFIYHEMDKNDSVLGPLYFSTFEVIMYFVVVNMFLGIIGKAYAEVCKQPSLAGDEYRVVDFIIAKTTKYFDKKKVIPKEAKYMDILDSLNMRLDTLDRLVTQDCRAILGLERQALQRDTENTIAAPSKEMKMEDFKQNFKKLAFLTKLQHSGDNKDASPQS